MNEPTQPGNPHRLTRHQHVYPAKLIERFGNVRGRVVLIDGVRKVARLAKPSDSMFCAERAWDQRAEAGYMKEIEDRFHDVCADWSSIFASGTSKIQDSAIAEFFALWYFRSRRRHVPWLYSGTGGAKGSGLTKDLHEIIEKKHAVALNNDGEIAFRHVNGSQIQYLIDAYVSHELADLRWSAIETRDDEIIVPDIPNHTILPISPHRFFYAGADSGFVTRDNLAEINNILTRHANEYVIMHQPDSVPFRIYETGGVTRDVNFDDVLKLWSYTVRL